VPESLAMLELVINGFLSICRDQALPAVDENVRKEVFTNSLV
jgi:hypothetical protein